MLGMLWFVFLGFCHVFLYNVHIVIRFRVVAVGCFIGFDEDMVVLSDFLQVFV